MKLQAYFAEMLGTFALVLAVSVSLVTNSAVATPIVAALTVGLFVYTVGGLSGAHFNPAVTIALASVKKISLRDGVMYILFQLGGAALAMIFVQNLLAPVAVLPSNAVEVGLAEAIGAFILVFGISAVANKKVGSDASGIVIGGSLLLGILIAPADL